MNIFLLILMLVLPAVEVRAEIFRFTDKSGQIWYTDRLSAVPEEYRDQIKKIIVPQGVEVKFGKDDSTGNEMKKGKRDREENKTRQEGQGPQGSVEKNIQSAGEALDKEAVDVSAEEIEGADQKEDQGAGIFEPDHDAAAVPEEAIETIPELVPAGVPDIVSDDVPEVVPGNVPEDVLPKEK